MRKITYFSSLVLIFLVPWEDSVSAVSLGSLVRLTGFVVAGLWLATLLIEGGFRKLHPFHVLVLLFFLWNFASTFWSLNIENTLQRIKTYSQIFILILIYWEVFQKPKELMTGLQAYVFGAYVPVISTIYNYLVGNVAVKYEGRYSATGVNAVDLALILMLGLPIAMQLFFVASRDKKGVLLQLINLLYLPLSIFSIVLTGSRMSLIAIIPFFVFMAGTRQIRVERKFLVFGVLLVSLLVLLPFIPQSVIDRLASIGSSIGQGDLGGRINLWWEASAVLAKHPILGVGSGAVASNIGSAVH
ncbi:MAG: O-antigen ligase family protein, partial [Anaerolineales bacterium]